MYLHCIELSKIRHKLTFKYRIFVIGYTIESFGQNLGHCNDVHSVLNCMIKTQIYLIPIA